MQLRFECHTPGVEKEPVVVAVSLDGKAVDEIVFDRKGGEKRWYYVGAGSREQEQGEGERVQRVRDQRSEIAGQGSGGNPG
ncbi:MAG: hypothetical protein U5R49_06305 [Deltaproteobacteria bacterium]|nr:hypothetical protein [Deltaproteobacteria bacterium]